MTDSPSLDEDEERQVELLLDHLRETDDRYAAVEREVRYSDGDGRCDLVTPTGTPVEAKPIRYWRANGDPEPAMYGRVFVSPDTLLTDAHRPRGSAFGDPSGLPGLFYTRTAEDPETVEALSERYTATDVAEKVVRDIDHRYDAAPTVCRIAELGDLQRSVHGRGAVISLYVE